MFVCLAERHSLPHQPVGHIRRQAEALRRQFGHAVGVERERRDHSGEGGKQHLQRLDRVEDGFLVFLKVAVVRERQTLQGREETGEITDETARLAARQFGDVRILLLRHDRRAGRIAVVERHERELAGIPEDDLLGETRQVDADHRGDERELGDDIATRGRIDGVLGGARESQGVRDVLRVEAERAAREGPRPIGRDRGSGAPVSQSLEVSHQRPGVCEQVVCEQYRLGVLQVGPARHRGIGMRGRLSCDRVDELNQQAGDHGGMVEQIQPHKGGDLVVAAAAGAEPAAQFGAGDLDESALERPVHVLVGLERGELTARDSGVERIDGREHPFEFRGCQIASLLQRRRVRPRPSQVILRELPIEVSRAAERGERGRRAGREPGTPQRAFVGCGSHSSGPFDRLRDRGLLISTGSAADRGGGSGVTAG